MSLNKSLLIFVFCIHSAFALETDNFLTWGVELEDSALDVNNYINEHIEAELLEINTKNIKSCDKVRKKLILSFRGFITHPMEHWIESSLGPKKVFPSEEEFTERDYFNMSIYATEKFDVSKFYSLSRNININGVYFGTDKLSHWMSTGERYFRKYKKAIQKGKSEEDALRFAINYGIFLDRYILGGISSGVFSYGDLEANFQGLMFNRSFCRLNKELNYLTQKDGKWMMQRKVDVKEYVNPNWDETFNPSLFSVLKWDMVKRNFKKENCQKLQNNVHADRFAYYNQILKPSFSFEYIKGLKQEGRRLPRFQERNYTTICE